MFSENTVEKQIISPLNKTISPNSISSVWSNIRLKWKNYGLNLIAVAQHSRKPCYWVHHSTACGGGEEDRKKESPGKWTCHCCSRDFNAASSNLLLCWTFHLHLLKEVRISLIIWNNTAKGWEATTGLTQSRGQPESMQRLSHKAQAPGTSWLCL